MLLNAAYSTLVTEEGNTFTKRRSEKGQELIAFD